MSEKGLVVSDGYSEKELDLIKATIAKGATTAELSLFLYRCKNMGLDPLKSGEVHFIKYGGQPGTMIVGVDGFRKRASKTGKHVGTKRGVIREDGKLVGGWAEVYRSDWKHPAREEVSLDEYNTGKAEWAKKPETMIKKVAEVAALRMAFPDELGGLYSDVERDVTAEPKTKAVAAAIQETTERPEFEEHADLLPPEAPSYKIRAGKSKGKRLDEVDLNKLQGYISWANEQADITALHQDIQDDVFAIADYLNSLKVNE